MDTRLAGSALSIAKALAKAAPWDGILASVCVMPGQLELGHLWHQAQPLRIGPGETLGTYLLPVQAAPAYAQHPSAPQSKTRGDCITPGHLLPHTSRGVCSVCCMQSLMSECEHLVVPLAVYGPADACHDSLVGTPSLDFAPIPGKFLIIL